MQVLLKRSTHITSREWITNEGTIFSPTKSEYMYSYTVLARQVSGCIYAAWRE